MINKINISGFKSLCNFSITLHNGLNVLVGPNGVGKTNICQALNLISSIALGNIQETLMSLGGADTIFNKFLLPKKIISLSICGSTNGELNSDKVSKEIYNIKYKYSAKLTLRNQMIALAEELHISRENNPTIYVPVININSSRNKLKYKILDKTLIGDFKLPNKNFTVNRYLDESLWGIMHRISYVCFLTWKDLCKIKTINIDPHVARQACDLIEPKQMLSNGKYLSNALYYIAKEAGKFGEIESINNQILPYEMGIKSEFDKILLKRYFSFITPTGEKISSNSLSDGTIKLLGLLVGIEDSKDYTLIVEEPENYVHPQAQQLLIDFLRETFENRMCIITCHSETILNRLNPEELIILGHSDNHTVCHRIDSESDLNESILSSGFGCGYHLVSGNLSYRENI